MSKLTQQPEYHVWENMMQRCGNPNHPHWNKYGGRGIVVCERWKSFQLFFTDMGSRPSEKHSLERIDNSMGYLPENCRWATQAEQLRNTRRNVVLTLDDVTMCITDWSSKTGIKLTTLRQRIKMGWSVEYILTKPISKFHSDKTISRRDRKGQSTCT